MASDIAVGMTLCLFDSDGTEHQVPLLDNDAGVWHGFVPGVGAGTAYGFRATGPWNPSRGQRCNPAKLLLDPYARAISGEVRFGPEVLDYVVGDLDAPSLLDSADHVPRSLVVDQAFDWEGDVHPATNYADTVFYEAHVKGLTNLHPDVPPELRGSYAALGHPAVIAHLVDLGVTAVELLPVHQSVPEAFLVEQGRTNYWGYNTIGYLAPHEAYSAHARSGLVGGQVDEFKTMVKRLHAAGLEVILDVVFNHTAEGGYGGPTLCHRGLDNPAYYRLSPADPRFYVDTTGTGNSLNVDHATTLRLIMDSLRYWILEMHVDGFRFDLATTLAREDGSFERTASFFDLITQDPVVGRTKLIAEPWDVGQMDSYSLGRFPPLWSEWNGRYRDSVRDFWRGTDGMLGELATRLVGVVRPVRRLGPTPVGVRQPGDGPRRLHAARPRQLRPEAQRGERRAEPRRDHRQPVLEQRRGGADGRPGRQRPARSAHPGDPHDVADLAGRTAAARWRRARPDAGRQQQRVLPGRPDDLGGLGRTRTRRS